MNAQKSVPRSGGYWMVLMWLHAKQVLWKIGTFIITAPIYVHLISEGFRMTVPELGYKFSRFPITSFLGRYQETRNIDFAMFAAIGLLIAVWKSWEWLLEVKVCVKTCIDETVWDFEALKSFYVIIGAVLIAADGFLFYRAVSQMSWASSFSFTAAIATAAYVGLTVFISMTSLKLRKEIEAFHSKENRP